MSGFDSDLFDRAVAAERRRARRTRLMAFVLGGAVLSPVGYFLAGLRGAEGRAQWVLAPFLSMAVLAAGLLAVRVVQWISGQLVLSVVQPGGRSRASAGYSRAESLAAAGRLDEAAVAFEESRASGGSAIAALRAEAELHATGSGDARRAESLYLQIRKSPEATRSDELYASHRLIDLYLGALDDPGRAMVELRRMADRFPDTIDGQGARDALQRRRDAMRE